MKRFLDAIHSRNDGTPPIWFMRQAGRYHSHYQNLKKKHSFMELCKDPSLASEVTKGPIEDFDFDAAILFSDLLFPLEALGMGLEYSPGPKLGWQLQKNEDLSKLKKGGEKLARELSFQGEALLKIRAWLPRSKGLISFIGSPLTLFYYAAEGSHQAKKDGIEIASPTSAHQGLKDGRFQGFLDHLVPLLVENLCLQAEAGADAIAIFDTCGGELTPDEFAKYAWPPLSVVLALFKKKHPNIPLIYYSKGTNAHHWKSVDPTLIKCLGVDWNTPIEKVLSEWTQDFSVQGNFDPHHLLLPEKEFREKLTQYLEKALSVPREARRGWISGLGHGVLQTTPEANVKTFIREFREIFQ